MKKSFTVLLLLLLLTASGCQKNPTPPTPPLPPDPAKPTTAVRGMWVPASDSDALMSRENIQRMVDECASYGVNHLFIVAWTRGFTSYPSPLMQQLFNVGNDPRFAGRDPMKEVIEIAHKKNIKVYAWFEYGFAADFGAANAHILTQKPTWAARSANGSITTKNGFRWMNSLKPEVQNFMIDLIKEAVTTYDLDGIQGDDRLPAMPSEAGYDAETVALYQQENNGSTPPANMKDLAWVSWRATKLTDFLGRLKTAVKTIKPNCQISMSPSVFPFSRDEYLQDWPEWLKKGHVDMICPQIYRRDLSGYQNELNKVLTSQITASQKTLLVPGLLLRAAPYVASDTLLNAQVNANRQAGLPGEIFFHYEGTRTRKAFFEKIYK